jgi:hypothetical protein
MTLECGGHAAAFPSAAMSRAVWRRRFEFTTSRLFSFPAAAWPPRVCRGKSGGMAAALQGHLAQDDKVTWSVAGVAALVRNCVCTSATPQRITIIPRISRHPNCSLAKSQPATSAMAGLT